MNTATFDKETLLEQIEKKEFIRLFKMTNDQLREEMEEWFEETPDETETRDSIIKDLLTDFMSYRKDDSIEELTEILNNYK